MTRRFVLRCDCCDETLEGRCEDDVIFLARIRDWLTIRGRLTTEGDDLCPTCKRKLEITRGASASS